MYVCAAQAPAVRTWVFEHWNEPMTIDKFCADGLSTLPLPTAAFAHCRLCPPLFQLA